MPQEDHALYSRGKYRLEWDRRRDGSFRTPFLQIVWYDAAARRNRSRSTGETEIGAAEDALDRLYLQQERGQAVCPTCNRPIDSAGGCSVSLAIADYLLEVEDRASISSIKRRLADVQDYFADTGQPNIQCERVDAETIKAFRKWAIKRPTGKGEPRSLGTVEASVRALAAAINSAYRRGAISRPPAFKALQADKVSRTPTYRADVAGLAAMFRYCLHPEPPVGVDWTEKQYKAQLGKRKALLRFLRFSVATWCRPDAAHDFSTDPKRGQWISAARVVRLNPNGREQTRKHRPELPIPEKMARLLDAAPIGFYVGVGSVRQAYEAMQDALALPRGGETGKKLIRRSMAHIVRRRIGEERWEQGRMMLGHRKASTSDLYALFDPSNLGVVLEATTAIIDEIEALAPGAFTGPAPELKIVVGGKNG